MSNWVSDKLTRWGSWHIKNLDNQGYYSTNTIARIMQGSAPRPGHRVLCEDMPAELWKVHLAVMALTPPKQAADDEINIYTEALVIKYCAPLKSDGQPYTNRELARKLDVSPRNFKERCIRGRKYFKRAYNLIAKRQVKPEKVAEKIA